jgi:hypothetical protein
MLTITRLSGSIVKRILSPALMFSSNVGGIT